MIIGLISFQAIVWRFLFFFWAGRNAKNVAIVCFSFHDFAVGVKSFKDIVSCCVPDKLHLGLFNSFANFIHSIGFGISFYFGNNGHC